MQIAETAQSGHKSLTQVEATEYLESIQELAQELDRAMHAIVAKQLPVFEESLSRQRATCSQLAELPRRFAQRRAADVDPDPALLDSELEGRITAATAALLALNGRYSALLKHSGDTMRLFAGLFRSYTGTTQQARGMQTNMHTWSCEL